MAIKGKKLKKNGMLIVFEGTEGAGKTTQSKLLVDNLRSKRYTVRRYKFPTYTLSGSLAYGYLDPDTTEIDSESLDGYQAASLYLVDMVCHAKEINEALNNGEIVIIDRYVGTNYYNQAVRSLDCNSISFEMALKKFITEIKDMAFNKLSIPRPDTTIFLELTYEESRKRRENDSTRVQKDFHEQNEDYVKNVTKTAILAAEIEKWKKINCDNSTIDEIQNEIVDLIQEEIRKNQNYFILK